MSNLIDSIKRRFATGSFSRHAATLMSGTLIAQLIGFAALPFLTRLYSVSDFGAYALYMAIAAFGTVVSTARYEMAIMLPKDNRDAINIVALSVLIATTLSLVIFLLIVSASLVCNIFHLCGETPSWVYLIPLAILLTGIYQSLNYWLSRNKQFIGMSHGVIVQAIVAATVSLLISYVGQASVYGLICGNIAGLVAGIFVFSLIARSSVDLEDVSIISIKLNAFRYKEFPKVNSIHVLTDTLQSSGIPILINYFFGNRILGFYSFAIRMLKLPTGIVGSAVSQVLYQRASLLYANNEDLYGWTRRILKISALVSIPIFFVIFIFGDHLVVFVFGNEWKKAGHFVQLFSPWVCSTFIAGSLSGIFLILNMQKLYFFISLVGMALTYLALAIGGFIFNNADIAFEIMVGLLVIYYIVGVYYLLKVIRTEQIHRQARGITS